MFTAEDDALLASPSFAKLATLLPDGSPQNTVMWFRRAGDTLRMIAPASSRKARNLLRDPRVAVAIDDAENGYRYVEIRGIAEVVQDDAEARIELGHIAARYIGDRAGADVGSLSAEPRVIIVIQPASVRRHQGQRPASSAEAAN